MFKYKSKKEALIDERRKNEQLLAQSLKQKSDIDYIAMMCDVELESAITEENENE